MGKGILWKHGGSRKTNKCKDSRQKSGDVKVGIYFYMHTYLRAGREAVVGSSERGKCISRSLLQVVQGSLWVM